MEQFYNQCETVNKPGTIVFSQELTDQWDKLEASVPPDLSPEWAQLILFAVGGGTFPESVELRFETQPPQELLQNWSTAKYKAQASYLPDWHQWNVQLRAVN
jgi:hypothetical protein